MQRITDAMERFRADPEDAAGAASQLSGRRDEIGRAEAELDRMQADLRAALNSRARLAALGEAVAKINHDLKNMLTSAQIASERLAALKDPKVSQALPRLERALDRAVKLASGVLAYGKTQEAAPGAARRARWPPAVEAAAEEARLRRARRRAGLPTSRTGDAGQRRPRPAAPDPGQPAAQRPRGDRAPGGPQRRGAVASRSTLTRADDASLIRVADNGPGVPERARERLFQPFAGSARPDGAGLGLAIARELAQGHGGDLTLVATGPEGSVFEAPAARRAGAARRRRRRAARGAGTASKPSRDALAPRVGAAAQAARRHLDAVQAGALARTAGAAASRPWPPGPSTTPGGYLVGLGGVDWPPAIRLGRAMACCIGSFQSSTPTSTFRSIGHDRRPAGRAHRGDEPALPVEHDGRRHGRARPLAAGRRRWRPARRPGPSARRRSR